MKKFIFAIIILVGLPLSAKPSLIDARKQVQSMRDNISKVLNLLKEARDKNDLVKVNCINEKFSLIKGIVKVAEFADLNFREAIVQGNDELAAEEFTKIEVSRERVDQLMIETESCVGEGEIVAGGSQLEISIDKTTSSSGSGTLSGVDSTGSVVSGSSAGSGVAQNSAPPGGGNVTSSGSVQNQADQADSGEASEESSDVSDSGSVDDGSATLSDAPSESQSAGSVNVGDVSSTDDSSSNTTTASNSSAGGE